MEYFDSDMSIFHNVDILPICHAAWSCHALHDNDAFCYFWHQTYPIVSKNTKSIIRMHSGPWSTLIRICQYFIRSTFLPICHAAWSCHVLHDNDAFCYFWHQTCPMVSKNTKSIVRMHSGTWSTLIQIYHYFVMSPFFYYLSCSMVMPCIAW